MSSPSDRDWLADLTPIDWSSARQAHRRCRDVLRRLADDRSRLSRLVYGLAGDPELFAESTCHSVMDRLTIYRDDRRGLYLRLHVSPGTNELIPHDHKYSFTSYILAGGYTHIWRPRRAALDGEFVVDDVPVGTITIERPTSCYTLGASLVHQTLMEADTVTLFMRGPNRFQRSNAAADLMTWDAPVDGTGPFYLEGERPMEKAHYEGLRARLAARGLIDELVGESTK